jgi:hypothetical protein
VVYQFPLQAWLIAVAEVVVPEALNVVIEPEMGAVVW